MPLTSSPSAVHLKLNGKQTLSSVAYYDMSQYLARFSLFLHFHYVRATNANEAEVCRKQKLAMQTSTRMNHYLPDVFGDLLRWLSNHITGHDKWQKCKYRWWRFKISFPVKTRECIKISKELCNDLSCLLFAVFWHWFISDFLETGSWCLRYYHADILYYILECGILNSHAHIL